MQKKVLLYPLSVWLVAAALAVPLAAQELKLGEINFPNSGKPAAQEHFVRGVLYLHNFVFEDAQEEFRAAQKADPDFALAYWGEAMSRNWPLWREVHVEEGRAALQKLAPTLEARLAKAPTGKEKGLLRAVDHLFFDEGGKTARDRAYSEAMGRLYAQHPGDDDIASLYALSILALTNGKRDFRNYMKAASIVEEVIARNPRHPGGAHYLIHSYDDPIHAPLGLRAARLYNKIAPDASHAQHMVSHIYMALGRWPESVQANQRAWDVSRERVKRKQLKIDEADFHAYSWLHYALLQQGQVPQATEMLKLTGKAYEERGTSRLRHYRSYMRASQVIETRAEQPLLPSRNDSPYDLYGDAMAALHRGDLSAARELAAQLPAENTIDKIHKWEVEALANHLAGDSEDAVTLLRRAEKEENALPMAFGPPKPIKPSSELLGEILLSLDRWEEARQAFEQALSRAPRRALSLRGLADALRRLGEKTGAEDALNEYHKVRETGSP